MNRLSELKDEQMLAAKQGWETKFKQLLDEVCLCIFRKGRSRRLNFHWLHSIL